MKTLLLCIAFCLALVTSSVIIAKKREREESNSQDRSLDERRRSLERQFIDQQAIQVLLNHARTSYAALTQEASARQANHQLEQQGAARTREHVARSPINPLLESVTPAVRGLFQSQEQVLTTIADDQSHSRNVRSRLEISITAAQEDLNGQPALSESNSSDDDMVITPQASPPKR